MKKRLPAALLAALTLCTTLAVDTPLTPISAAGAYDISVTVNTNGTRTPISPYIYGINSKFRSEEYLYDATAGSARQGGNRFSAYNWENNYSSAGRDWEHYSDAYLVDFDSELLEIPGAPAIGFAQEASEKNIPYKLTTIQMAGYVAADGDGSVTEEESAPSSRWIKVKAAKGSAFSMTPDKTDDCVYMDEYVNYLVNTLGDSTTSTGYQGYSLDNEPSLWWTTHARMHPEQPTCAEIVEKSIEYASAIKNVDPHAEIFGLALFGVNAYTTFSGAPDWNEHAEEYDWFLSYYLDQMAKAEQQHGKRLIDVMDLHYYSEDTGLCRVTSCEDYTHTECIEARLQSTRSLYDSTYIENSWIGKYEQEYLPILPNVQKSIDTYYPGTKLSFTEYSFGGGNHISGAIAQADALGIFGAYGVYTANFWVMNSDCSYQLSAIDLYTNYDGKGASFGDTHVPSETSDIEKATSWASIHGDDPSKANLILTNKSLTDTQNAAVTFNSDADYSTALVYGITGDSSEIQLLDTITNISGNTFTVEVPALSVVHIVLTDEDYILSGDVNEDSVVDTLDAQLLADWLVQKPGTKLSLTHADMLSDGSVNVFDLSMLRRKLGEIPVPEEKEPVKQAFWETDTATWKVKNGMGGKTITCTLKGEPGYRMNMGYGYWDTIGINPETGNAGVWVNNDSTKINSVVFDENGKAVVEIAVPEGATSLQIMVFYYAIYDASIGDNIVRDKGEVELVSVTLPADSWTYIG
ncbi:MAG: endoglucanase [Ruminococcus sp.]|nr:endoglucanase [Ruminococcus sp.]